jgi:hypothetical protein
MKKISKIVLICGVVLFVIGVMLPMFPPITINITIGIDQFPYFPIGIWLSPILMGSGLCLVGITIVLEFMTRKNP